MDFPWLRKIKLTLGGKTYESDGTQKTLRVSCHIEKHLQSLAGGSNIEIYNLTADSRKELTQNMGQTEIIVEAGWLNGPKAGMAQCFKGKSFAVMHHRAGSDIVTSIEAMSGIGDVAGVEISATYPPGFPVARIIDTVSGATGLPKGPGYCQDITEKVGKVGLTLNGTVKECMDTLANLYRFTWNITDGQFFAAKDGVPVGNNLHVEAPYLISATPTFVGQLMCKRYSGIQVKCAYEPTAMPMANLSVKSGLATNNETVSGFLIHRVTHSLDCWNSMSFTTDITAVKFGNW